MTDAAVSDAADLATRIGQFKRDGYYVFRDLLDGGQIAALHTLRDEGIHEFQFLTGRDTVPDAIGNLLEKAPRLILPIVGHSSVVAFAERIMGPFIQLDAVVTAGDPPIDASEKGLPVFWHRDRFGHVPIDGVYLRPLTVVVLCYLQDMTVEFGPLHVLPGSHMQAITLGESETRKPMPGQQALQLKAGDSVVVHHNLLHSAGRNVSGRERRFLGFVYNLTGMRQEDNFHGPNCMALVERARESRDLRLRRLLGDAEEFVFARQIRSGFLVDDETAWAQWIREDDQAMAEPKPFDGGRV